ncbi:hypothetical protein [Pseudoalteromonas sp.]|uniref:hypothetical protein n=1 Tax=Pseudoalteromonas sp. TaxID=53249 RepID=UPI0026039055|nr:hypothetical protein [Pseudoalteromonas sp.]MCP4586952.1 hypothetical protein [Pseudoalteromonas sp.]
MFPEERTRTTDTEDKYVIRANQWIIRYFTDSGANKLDVHFINYVVDMTRNKSFANWRLVKASLIHYLDINGKSGLAKSLSDIDASHTDKKCLIKRTSAKKKKSFSEVEADKISKYLFALVKSGSPGKNDIFTLAMFNATLSVGLRPQEWCTCELIDSPIDGVDAEPPILKVKNAKATNGRSFSEYRYIGLSKLDKYQMSFIKLTIMLLSENADITAKKSSVAQASRRLSAVYTRFFPKAKEKISMYSGRHQLIANLKKRVTQK